jgi:hypothetical protein
MLKIVIFVLLLSSYVLFGESISQKVLIGGNEVKISPPTGFVDGSKYNFVKLMVELQKRPESNTLAFYVSETELPKLIKDEDDLILENWCIVSSNLMLDDINITREIFQAEKAQLIEIRKSQRQYFLEAYKEAFNSINTNSERVFEDKELGKELKVKSKSKLQHLGWNAQIESIHHEGDNFFSWSTHQSNGENYSAWLTQTLMHINQKAFLLMSFSTHKSGLKMTQSVTKNWVNRINLLN